MSATARASVALALWVAHASFPVAAAERASPVECDTLEVCLDLVPETVDASAGIGPRETALAKRVQGFGAAAVPDLIEMLSARDEATRDFAGYTLSDIDGLGPEHVEPIVQAALKVPAGGWLPPALARIATPEAVAGLVALVRKYPEQSIGSQIGSSFARLRAQGVPGLLELISDPDHPNVRRAASSILTDLDADDGGAAGALVTIAADRTRPEAVRLDVLETLEAMGPRAASTHDALMELLRSSTGDYQGAVATTLAAIGGSGLGEIYDVLLAPPEVPFDGYVTSYWEQIGFGDSGRRLLKVASLGERGRDAVPAVLKLLRDPDPNLRVHAARTLGFIGDASVGPHLVALIGDDDWLMVRSVVESLGRIRYQSAREDVALVASRHWYPPVREVARQAAAALDGREPYAPIHGGLSFDAFDPEQLPVAAPKACATTARYPIQSATGDRFEAKPSPERAKQFSYQYDVRAYYPDLAGVEDLPEGLPKSGLVDQIPDVGLRGPGGWFLGASRGEFGGELVWRPDRGADHVVVRDNVEDVYELAPGRFVATAGLAHLGSDSGRVYRLDGANGRWRARWWVRLPGMPTRSWQTADGQLVIDTTHGSLVLDRNGRLRMADCAGTR